MAKYNQSLILKHYTMQILMMSIRMNPIKIQKIIQIKNTITPIANIVNVFTASITDLRLYQKTINNISRSHL